MPDSGPAFTAKIADTPRDLRDAQALRYAVFVRELGGDGAGVDHALGLERDSLDAVADHLILRDSASGELVGVYRLMREAHAARAGGFYSEAEYDLAPLRATGRPLLELGRSCLHPAYRGGTAMAHLWSALAAYVSDHGIGLLFGTASFHGTDAAALAAPLGLLHARHLAPPDLRVRARGQGAAAMDTLAEHEIDRRAAMLRVPSLIKAYLRLGGVVGEGAYVDRAFNTTDVCMILDTARLSARAERLYGAPARG